MFQVERDPFDLNSPASVPSRQFLPTEALIVTPPPSPQGEFQSRCHLSAYGYHPGLFSSPSVSLVATLFLMCSSPRNRSSDFPCRAWQAIDGPTCMCSTVNTRHSVEQQAAEISSHHQCLYGLSQHWPVFCSCYRHVSIVCPGHCLEERAKLKVKIWCHMLEVLFLI